MVHTVRFSRTFVLVHARLLLAGLVLASAAFASAALAELPVEGEARTPLEEVLAHAHEHAPGLSVLEKEAGRASARQRATRPLLLENPTLEVGIGPRFGGASGEDFDFVASLGQPVGVSGERRRQKDVNREFQRRLEAERDFFMWQLDQAVELAYRTAVREEARWALEERALTFATKLAQATERRAIAGEVSVIELHVAQADLAHARQQHARAVGAAWDARLALAEVAGYPLDAPPLPSRDLLRLAEAPELAPLLERLADHPALACQDAVVAEEHAETRLEDRRAWVKPTLGVQVAREGSAGSPANYIVLGMVGLPLPAFQRGQATRAEQRVDEAVARAQREQTRRMLEARVVRAHAELVIAQKQAALLRKEVLPALEQGLILIERAYQAGELDVLRASLLRERLFVVERDALEAEAEYVLRLVALESAVGRDLSLPQATSGAGGAS